MGCRAIQEEEEEAQREYDENLNSSLSYLQHAEDGTTKST
jgi:hypothetical protein